MKFKKFGNTDLSLSRIGIGAWAMGGNWEWGWGAQQDADSIQTIQHALSQGVNWIDTAPVYGLGHSEEVVGRAIKEMSDKPLIFTKCGFRWDDKQQITPSLIAKSVREEVEASLKRLGVDCIDLYQIHWPDPEGEIEEGWQAIADLRKDGKIRYAGVSNHSVEQMKRLQAITPIDSLQPPYNLISRDCESDILPYCLDKQMGVIAYSPMASGMLTGKMTRERIASLGDDDWRKKAEDFNEPKLTHNLKVVDALQVLADKHACSVAEVAIAWVLSHPALTAAIVGMRTPQQVDGVIGGVNIELDSTELNWLNTI